jgi:hypothetical protein
MPLKNVNMTSIFTIGNVPAFVEYHAYGIV